MLKIQWLLSCKSESHPEAIMHSSQELVHHFQLVIQNSLERLWDSRSSTERKFLLFSIFDYQRKWSLWFDSYFWFIIYELSKLFSRSQDSFSHERNKVLCYVLSVSFQVIPNDSWWKSSLLLQSKSFHAIEWIKRFAKYIKLLHLNKSLMLMYTDLLFNILSLYQHLSWTTSILTGILEWIKASSIWQCFRWTIAIIFYCIWELFCKCNSREQE
jgi:hypothetical protein